MQLVGKDGPFVLRRLEELREGRDQWGWASGTRKTELGGGETPHAKLPSRVRITSMGLTVIVSAESSQSISASLAASVSWVKCWWAIRTRYTPMATTNTSMHTEMMMTTVAMLGTTGTRKELHGTVN